MDFVQNEKWSKLSYRARKKAICLLRTLELFLKYIPMISVYNFFFFNSYICMRCNVRKKIIYATSSHKGKKWVFLMGIFMFKSLNALLRNLFRFSNNSKYGLMIWCFDIFRIEIILILVLPEIKHEFINDKIYILP